MIEENRTELEIAIGEHQETVKDSLRVAVEALTRAKTQATQAQAALNLLKDVIIRLNLVEGK